MVTVGSVLYYLVSLYLTPHHEGVHRSLNMSHWLSFGGIRVGGGGGGVNTGAGEDSAGHVVSLAVSCLLNLPGGSCTDDVQSVTAAVRTAVRSAWPAPGHYSLLTTLYTLSIYSQIS